MADLHDRRVLVTGASGFLGSHLCRRLRAQGAEVHGVSRQARQDEAGLRWWRSDGASVEAFRRLLADIKPNLIYHLSGHVTASPQLDLVLPIFHSLLESTVHLLAAAAEHGAPRVVLTGSLTEPAPTVDDVAPASPYAAAKWAASAYGRLFHELYHLPVVIARPFMTYGPGQGSTKVIPYVTRCLLQGDSPKLSSGQWQTDWIYVDDVIEGLVAVGTVPGIEGATFDLGSGVLHSVSTVVQRIAYLLDSHVEPVFGAVPDRPNEQPRVAELGPALARLNWKPLIPLDAGLMRTIEWYRRQSS